jgi:hypothetical protein
MVKASQVGGFFCAGVEDYRMMRNVYRAEFYDASAAEMQSFSFEQQCLQQAADSSRSDDEKQRMVDAPVDVY